MMARMFLLNFAPLIACVCTTLCAIPSVAQWEEANTGIFGGQVTCLVNCNGNIFAGTPGGIFISNNFGNSWTPFQTGLDNTYIKSIKATTDGRVFAATQGGSKLFVSSPPYSKWVNLNIALPSDNLESIATVGGSVFILSSRGNLYKIGEIDNSSNLIAQNLNKINSITSSNNNLFAATPDGVFLSTDSGTNWQAVDRGLFEKSIFSLTSFGSNLIASAINSPVFFSGDSGATWQMTTLETDYYRLIEVNGILFAGNQSRVYFSNDRGFKWDQVRQLPGASDFVSVGSSIFAANRYGIFKSFNSGQSWAISNTANLSNAFVVGFGSNDKSVFCGTSSGVYRSDNIGKTWSSISKGLPLDRTTGIQFANSKLFVALSNYGIYQSADNGASWSLSFGVPSIFCFANLKEDLFAGGVDGMYILSNDSWAKLRNISGQVKSLVVKGDTLFACSPAQGIRFSTDRGQTWKFNNKDLPVSTKEFSTIFSFKNVLWIGSESIGSIYRQPQLSTPWQMTSEGLSYSGSISSFAADSVNFFTGGSNGVFTFSSARLNWKPFYNEQLPILSKPAKIESLHIHKNHIFAGTTGNGVWISCIEPSTPTISVRSIAPGDTVLVSNYPEGNQWFLNGQVMANFKNSFIKPTSSGEYSVKVSLNGCESKISNVQKFDAPGDPQLIMPNVFTPNEDLFNPFFRPLKYENISKADLKIIDRWGNEVFRSEQLLNGWNGGILNEGIYYYSIRYVGLNGVTGNFNGWVQLIR